ncbi:MULTISPECIES: regulatory protein RecX [Gammaproteobacteria]|uniref:Regulatory protein RecX n=1 Tax=Vreelandella halophila TaxID=86177 RepID=A0A9X5B4D9_9GAMM|nr:MULTISPECIES: regulatory protein RecX [Gammaproteobacteria]KAA8976940.1 regulatory protein RecX [Halospina sp. K52047b]MYL26275.1 regulatory protein RecX [Halomonas utahensis]MYL73612.1 regulatory protein RecX [Halomonas sp. 22501_18_FS]
MSDDRQYLRERAMKLLARREHSRLELWRKLERAAESGELLAEVLDELAGEGWQSDERFAESFSRQRIEAGYGPLRIRSELEQRGVSGDSQALTALAEDDWVNMALEQRQKRFGPEAPAEWKEKGRQGRFLAQKGYSHSHIEKALAMTPDDGLPTD